MARGHLQTPLCMASTRAHAGWSTRRCVELPSTNPTKSIQNQYKNRPTIIQQPVQFRTRTRTTSDHATNITFWPKAHSHAMRRTAPPAHPPPTTQKTPSAAPAPPPATLRHGAAGEAGGLSPKGRPHLQDDPKDPKGGTGATPRHPAPRRDEGDRRPTRRAAPIPSKK